MSSTEGSVSGRFAMTLRVPYDPNRAGNVEIAECDLKRLTWTATGVAGTDLLFTRDEPQP